MRLLASGHYSRQEFDAGVVASSDAARFCLLGPLRVLNGARELDLGPAKQRAVLAILLLHAGKSVSKAEIIAFVWGDTPPETVTNVVQTYVRGLRRALDPQRPARDRSGLLRSTATGYALDLDEAEVDLLRFRRLVAAARQFRQAGDDGTARDRLEAALSLWAAPPLADLGFVSRSHPAVTALEQEWFGAAIDLADLQRAAGTAADSVARLVGLTGYAPLHEPLHMCLMRAFAHTGRYADAMITYDRLRRRLHDELGVSPDATLTAVYEGLLQADTDKPSPVPGHPAAHLVGPAFRLLGRQRDLYRLVAILPRSRLVTLKGPGGVGKTALARTLADEIARRYAHGATVVRLGDMPRESNDPVSDPARAVCAALGVSHSGRESALDTIARALEGREGLLVLDNVEHVLSRTARLVDRLTRSCPLLHIVVTSRRPLAVLGEVVWEVEPLSLPAIGANEDEIARSAAVRLFFAQAARSAPELDLTADLALVVEICRKLGGLPLAIELAAARLRILSLQELHDRTVVPKEPLIDGSPHHFGHQRSVAGTIVWSLELTPETRRVLLERLAVFGGDFDLPAAEAVAGHPPLRRTEVLDELTGLVDDSLVQVVRRQRTNSFRILEPIREVVLGCVTDPGRLESAYRRHLAWCAEKVRELDRLPAGERNRKAIDIAAHLDEFVLALRWAVQSRSSQDYEVAAHILIDAWEVWHHSGTHLPTLRACTALVLDHADRLPRTISARIHRVSARLSWLSERPIETRSSLRSALSLLSDAPSDREVRLDATIGLAAVADNLADPRAPHLGEELLVAAARHRNPYLRGRVLRNVAPTFWKWNRIDDAATAIDESESIALTSGDQVSLIRTWHCRTELLIRVGELDEAAAMLKRELEQSQHLYPFQKAEAQSFDAWIHAYSGKMDEARRRLRLGLSYSRHATGGTSTIYLQRTFAFVEWMAGNGAAAVRHLRQSLEHAVSVSNLVTTVQLLNLATALAAAYELPGGREIAKVSRDCRLATGLAPWPMSLDACEGWEASLRATEKTREYRGPQSVVQAAERVLTLLPSAPNAIW